MFRDMRKRPDRSNVLPGKPSGAVEGIQWLWWLEMADDGRGDQKAHKCHLRSQEDGQGNDNVREDKGGSQSISYL